MSNLYRKYSPLKIIVTGHSLGGALATLGAYDLRLKFGGKVWMINFASPRVGNSRFAHSFNELFRDRSFRITRGNDIVPTIPPRALGFHHVGREVWYSGSSLSYKVCGHDGEDLKCYLRKKLGNLLKTPIAVCKLISTVRSIKEHTNYLGFSTSCDSGGLA